MLINFAIKSHLTRESSLASPLIIINCRRRKNVPASNSWSQTPREKNCHKREKKKAAKRKRSQTRFNIEEIFNCGDFFLKLFKNALRCLKPPQHHLVSVLIFIFFPAAIHSLSHKRLHSVSFRII